METLEEGQNLELEAETPTELENGAASPEGGEVTPEAPVAPVAMDQDMLKNVLSEVFKSAQPAKAAAPEPDPFDVSRLTPEELARKFNTWSPGEDFVQRLRSDDEGIAMAAVGELLNGVVRQAVTMSKFQQEAALQPVSKDLNRLQSYYAERREAEATAEFRKDYPDLEPWEPLVQAVREQFVREITAGTRPAFASTKDAFKALAEQTRTLVKKLPGGSGGTNTQKTQSTRPSTVIAGGQGGAGTGSSAPKAGKLEQLWS